MSDLEARVEGLAQDSEVIRRTRRLQLYSVGGGLLLIAAVFLLRHFGMAPRQLLSLIIPGVVLAIYGAS